MKEQRQEKQTQAYKLSSSSLKKYVKLYDLDKYLFKVVGPKARKRGYLTFNEFYNICMWKSVRPKKKYLQNKGNIKKISKMAFSEKDELKKINTLCNLKGVGISTGSAILSVVYPTKYPVIDIRCLSQLYHLEISKFKNVSEKTWLNYLKIMRKEARRLRTTPRKLDMALFAMHKERLDNKGLNLY